MAVVPAPFEFSIIETQTSGKRCVSLLPGIVSSFATLTHSATLLSPGGK